MSTGSKAFDWEKFIDLANILTGVPTEVEEAANRSIISRSYYGAFCLARNLARDRGWVVVYNNATDHERVKSYYKGDPNKIKQEIGLDLERLRRDRNYADYNDNFHNAQKRAHVSINRAKLICARLKSLT